VVVNNVQYQVEQLHRQTLRQLYVPPQQLDADEMDADEGDQMVQPCHTEAPNEGSSSSDSDLFIHVLGPRTSCIMLAFHSSE